MGAIRLSLVLRRLACGRAASCKPQLQLPSHLGSHGKCSWLTLLWPVRTMLSLISRPGILLHQSFPILRYPVGHGCLAWGCRTEVLLQHPLHNLPATDWKVDTVFALQTVHVMKHLIAFVAAQMTSVGANELRVVVLSNRPTILIVKVASFHLRHCGFLDVWSCTHCVSVT
jgi:hypothetical protein